MRNRVGNASSTSAATGAAIGGSVIGPDQKRAFREIPQYVLDAWLRVAERGSDMSPGAPSLHHVVAHVDMLVLERTRPDLITRAKLILGELYPA
ncbi:hypothetical protein [Kibdelosporangium phytohabitans]|uniref:hypothetical protein n=1 Tax=Kibdelosporangium phytohabitans TaxID=860235 RepID=UPI0007C818A3|nr:hypothetical protein [Kibdelosporangium phytohabitans]MBE1464776.1 hypothetical protein [Kibdelosporangium phytohabitans]